jgi:eukaryotic-like serine/threonine-protein kinase
MAESPTRTMRATRGRYELRSELGRGATATVWRARDTTTGRDVTLKRFHPHLVSDPVARRRIEEEAAAASRLTHPNIVSAVELIDDREGLALVFPYVAGETLAKRLARKPRIPPRDAARIALDISDALAVAHSQGVVHRDVKPGNILLGKDGRARLLDFGIAHAVEAEATAHDLTGAGMTIGTLPYMAPEQLAAEPTTPASDVYALGVVLYEMLAGKRPYAAATPVTLAQEQMQPPGPITKAPEPLVDLALAAMTPDLTARPDAAQLARGLSAWRDGRNDADAPTSLVAAAPNRQPRPQRTRPAAGWLAVALTALVLAIAVPVAASGLFSPTPDSLDLTNGTIDRPATDTPTVTQDQPTVVTANEPAKPDRSAGGAGGGQKDHDKGKGDKGKGDRDRGDRDKGDDREDD